LNLFSNGSACTRYSAAEVLSNEFLRGRRFAIVNVWRSAPGAGTIQRAPLAVCDPASVNDEADRVHYEMHYPDRVVGLYKFTRSLKAPGFNPP
jgi:hypothetical protein